MTFTQPLPNSGLAHGSATRGNLAAQQRQPQHAAVASHVAQLLQLRQHFADAAGESRPVGPATASLSRAGAAANFSSNSASACASAAAGSGWTATAVSPSIVSGRVVAIVTCVGSPGWGSITG